LFKKYPARDDPMILTITVEIGKPLIDKLKSENKYLRLEPIIAPVISAI
tara:strand:- start:219 stop:365 length:147 start_codon:yes stop_codon:yes gene_type:complete